MNSKQWDIFTAFRDEFKKQCEIWNREYSSVLIPLQKQAAEEAKPKSVYPHETAVVYNTAYDEITKEDVIRYIVIGDNPGKDEQLAKNRRYLVGQAGKLGQGFFAKHSEFNTDFRKNVIIINKTPVHSAKTNQLKVIAKNGGKNVEALLQQTQVWMAQKTARLHIDLCLASDTEDEKPEIWLVGYSELKAKGIFSLYRDEIKAPYTADSKCIALWTKVLIFQHFSMNRFNIDLTSFMKKHPDMDTKAALHALGEIHKGEIYACADDYRHTLVKRDFS